MGMLEFVVALVIVTAIVGYVSNIVKLTKHTGNFTGLSALRVVGIFMFPVGAVVGYFGER